MAVLEKYNAYKDTSNKKGAGLRNVGRGLLDISTSPLGALGINIDPNYEGENADKWNQFSQIGDSLGKVAGQVGMAVGTAGLGNLASAGISAGVSGIGGAMGDIGGGVMSDMAKYGGRIYKYGGKKYALGGEITGNIPTTTTPTPPVAPTQDNRMMGGQERKDWNDFLISLNKDITTDKMTDEQLDANYGEYGKQKYLAYNTANKKNYDYETQVKKAQENFNATYNSPNVQYSQGLKKTYPKEGLSNIDNVIGRYTSKYYLPSSTKGTESGGASGVYNPFTNTFDVEANKSALPDAEIQQKLMGSSNQEFNLKKYGGVVHDFNTPDTMYMKLGGEFINNNDRVDAPELGGYFIKIK